MTDTRFVIAPALLSGLAGLVPGEKSPLSPLYGPHPAELSPEDREALFQAGILDENGLVESARLMLAALAEAPSFARLRLNAPTGYMDEAIHFTGEGAQTVGISNTPDGLGLTSPGDAESVLKNVRQFISSSDRALTAWSVELLPIELLTLAALLDLRRKAVVRAIVDQQPVIPPPGDPHALTNAIQIMWGNPQWLTAAVHTTGSIPMPPSTPQVQSALAVLSQKRLTWQQNGNFYPEPSATQVADRFLLIGTILTLDAGSANLQGRYTLIRQSWLQAGMTEMLHITPVQEKLRLELVTPAAALEKVQLFLSTFDAIPAPHIELVDLSLVVQAGVGTGQVYSLQGETVLGRSEQAQIRILDSRASRRHAVIRKLNQGFQLSDAGSTNGTYLNRQLISTPVWLHEGDIISIGETQIKVFRTGEIQPPEASDNTVYAGEGRPLASEPVTPVPLHSENAGAAPQPAQPAAEAPSPLPEPEAGEELAPSQALETPKLEQPAVEAEPAESAIPLGPPESETPSEAAAPQEIEMPEAPPAESEAPAETPLETAEVCPRCSEPLEPGAQVCPNCGLALAQPEESTAPADHVCPECGNPVPAEAHFCGACGAHLIEE